MNKLQNIDLIYSGSTLYTGENIPPVENDSNYGVVTKPLNVLWTSPLNPETNLSEWEELTHHDPTMQYKKNDSRWHVIPDDDCKILILTPDSPEIESYKFYINDSSYRTNYALDFEKLAEEYDAIYISKDNQEKITNSTDISFAGWDITTCIFLNSKYNFLTDKEYALYKQGKTFPKKDFLKKSQKIKKEEPTPIYKKTVHNPQYFQTESEKNSFEPYSLDFEKQLIKILDKQLEEYDENPEKAIQDLDETLSKISPSSAIGQEIPRILRYEVGKCVCNCTETFGLKVIELSAQKGLIKLDKTDSKGNPPIFYSNQYTLDFYLKNDAINTTNTDGQTKLMQLLQNNDGSYFSSTTKHMEKYLEHGANPNLFDNDGKTALMYCKSAYQIELLLRYGADPTAVDNNSKSVLDYVKENYHTHKKGLQIIKEAIINRNKDFSLKTAKALCSAKRHFADTKQQNNSFQHSMNKINSTTKDSGNYM